MSSFLTGFGAYLPEKILESEELEKRLGLDAGWIVEKTGVARRHIAAEGECVSDLAAKAALSAVEDAELSVSDIDLIILASSMPDMFFPATACVVQQKIGSRAAAFDLSNACAGFIYALTTADALISAGRFKNVLVIGAETMSRMLDWNDYKTCIIFGDGAGACVVSAEGEHEFKGFYLGADGSGAEFLNLPGGGSRAPFSTQTIEAGLHTIYMDGGAVFRFAKTAIGDTVRLAAESACIVMEEISLIVPHQSNVRIIGEAAKMIGVPVEKFYLNLARVGNTAAASVPIALEEAVKKVDIQMNANIALVSYGAGLAYAGAIVEW